jgi:subtilisin family serine protease
MKPYSFARFLKTLPIPFLIRISRLTLAIFLVFLQLQPDAFAQSRFSSKKKSSPHSVDEKRLISRDEAIRQMNLKLDDQAAGFTPAEQRMIQRLRNKPKDEEPLDAGKKTGEHAGAAAVPDPASAPDQPYADLSSLSSSNINPDEALLQIQVLPASSIQDITSAISTNSVPSLIRSNDPYYDYMWWHQAVHATEAWEFGTGEGVVVAVVDTGVDILHEDLTRNIWINEGEINGDGIDNDNNGYVDDYYGWNFVSGTNNILDDNGHGTHVSGIIAATADNNIGIAGIAPNSKILPVKVANDKGASTYKLVLQGIKYAVDMGADVINVSMGELLADDRGLLFDGRFGPTPNYVDLGGNNGITPGEYDNSAEMRAWADKKREIEDMISYADQHDVLIVFAAGNDNQPVNASAFPISSDNRSVMVVGAMDPSGNKASFSNSGMIEWDADVYRQGGVWAGGQYRRAFSAGLIDQDATMWYLEGADHERQNGYIGNTFYGTSSSSYTGVAPGTDILSLRAGGTSFGTGLEGGSYAFASGTSMAAPVAAGIAALLKGARRYMGLRGEYEAYQPFEYWSETAGRNPFTDMLLDRYTPWGSYDVRNIMSWAAQDLLTSSDNVYGREGYDLFTGYGMFDALSSMSQMKDGEGNLIWRLLSVPDEDGATGFIYLPKYLHPESGRPATDFPTHVLYADGTVVTTSWSTIDTTHDGLYNPDLVRKDSESIYRRADSVFANAPEHYLFSETTYSETGEVAFYQEFIPLVYDGGISQQLSKVIGPEGTFLYNANGHLASSVRSNGVEYVYDGEWTQRVVSRFDPATGTRTFYDLQTDVADRPLKTVQALADGSLETFYENGVPVRSIWKNQAGDVTREKDHRDGSEVSYRYWTQSPSGHPMLYKDWTDPATGHHVRREYAMNLVTREWLAYLETRRMDIEGGTKVVRRDTIRNGVVTLEEVWDGDVRTVRQLNLQGRIIREGVYRTVRTTSRGGQVTSREVPVEALVYFNDDPDKLQQRAIYDEKGRIVLIEKFDARGLVHRQTTSYDPILGPIVTTEAF